jgi:glycosyltransferase involved in cell wall biosynthesis
MPAYNTAPWIGAAIESVLAQTRSDFELLVVDDGSSDGTIARVEQYLHDDRLKLLVSKANLGQARARNTAIDVARGTYVSLLDSDDLWLPRFLEVMADTLDSNHLASVVYTDAWVLDDGLRKIARRTAMNGIHPPSPPRDSESFLRALLERGNFVIAGPTIRLSTLTAVGPFRPLRGGEDYELMLRIAAHGYRFIRHPETLAIIRRRPGQTTGRTEIMRTDTNEVFRIVSEEYDIPDEIRRLAKQRLPMGTFFHASRPRRVPRLLRRPYNLLSRARWYHFRPPKKVRAALPDLRSL